MKWLAIAFLVAALLAVLDPIGARSDNDHQAIQGIWSVVAQRKGDRESAPSHARRMKVVLDAKRMVVISIEEAKGGGTYEFKEEFMYALDPSKNPKAIDLGVLAFLTTKGGEAAKGPEVVETWPGIYELSGDSLKVAFDQGRRAKKNEDGSFADKGVSALRPKNFDGGSSITVLTLKRAKK